MYKSIIFASTLLLFLTTSQSFSQNYVMDLDSSGFHGSVQLRSGNFENTIAIQPGYTWNGVLTAGIDFGKGTDKIRKLSLNIVRPNLNYLIIKQDEEGLPISINLETAYQYNILPATSFNSRSIQFGGTLYHEISIQDHSLGIKLIPQAGMLAVNTLSRNGIQTESAVEIVYNAGITVLWESVYFEPKFFVNDGNISYSLKVGYVL